MMMIDYEPMELGRQPGLLTGAEKVAFLKRIRSNIEKSPRISYTFSILEEPATEGVGLSSNADGVPTQNAVIAFDKGVAVAVSWG